MESLVPAPGEPQPAAESSRVGGPASRCAAVPPVPPVWTGRDDGRTVTPCGTVHRAGANGHPVEQVDPASFQVVLRGTVDSWLDTVAGSEDRDADS